MANHIMGHTGHRSIHAEPTSVFQIHSNAKFCIQLCSKRPRLETNRKASQRSTSVEVKDELVYRSIGDTPVPITGCSGITLNYDQTLKPLPIN